MCGASRWQALMRVTLPLARPAILAVLLLSFIRALEAFEVPLLIGIPGGVVTVTTALFRSIHSGFVPRYGEASAYAVLLTAAVSVPLFLYYRATREGAKFATVTGKGFRPSRIDLGAWKVPCALWVLIIPLSLCAPLLLMLWSSFLPVYTTPALDDLGRMSLANYAAVATRDDTVAGVWNSLVVGAGSASAVAAGTFVLSWIVVRRRQAVRAGHDRHRLFLFVPLVDGSDVDRFGRGDEAVAGAAEHRFGTGRLAVEHRLSHVRPPVVLSVGLHGNTRLAHARPPAGMSGYGRSGRRVKSKFR